MKAILPVVIVARNLPRWPEFEREIERRLAVTRAEAQRGHLKGEKAWEQAGIDGEKQPLPAE